MRAGGSYYPLYHYYHRASNCPDFSVFLRNHRVKYEIWKLTLNILKKQKWWRAVLASAALVPQVRIVQKAKLLMTETTHFLRGSGLSNLLGDTRPTGLCQNILLQAVRVINQSIVSYAVVS